MEKIRLSLDELTVQSFATTAGARAERGTVRGHDLPTDQVECPTADPNWNTCWATCGDTCGDSCGGSCGCGGPSDWCTYDCGSDWCSWDCSWTWYISWC